MFWNHVAPVPVIERQFGIVPVLCPGIWKNVQVFARAFESQTCLLIETYNVLLYHMPDHLVPAIATLTYLRQGPVGASELGVHRPVISTPDV